MRCVSGCERVWVAPAEMHQTRNRCRNSWDLSSFLGCDSWMQEFRGFEIEPRNSCNLSAPTQVPNISTSTSEFLQKSSFPAGIPALPPGFHGLWHRAYISICRALQWSDTRIVSFTTAKERDCTALACAKGHTTWQLRTNLAVLHPINETVHKAI